MPNTILPDKFGCHFHMYVLCFSSGPEIGAAPSTDGVCTRHIGTIHHDAAHVIQGRRSDQGVIDSRQSALLLPDYTRIWGSVVCG